MITSKEHISSRGFKVWKGLAALSAPYPEPGEFVSVLRSASPEQRELVVRLWIGEGVPFGFRSTPALYEELRRWTGRRLGVDPRDLTLIGSTRIGFSMSPGIRFGTPFSDNSDLDLSVISEQLFRQTKECFQAWENDVATGAVQPQGDRQRRLWPENLAFGRRNIPRGFMDPHKIPTLNRYELPRRVVNVMWELSVKLTGCFCGHSNRKTSARVYRDYEAFIRQSLLNLSAALDARKR